MNDRPASATDMGRYHLVPGMPVYDKAGELLGALDAASLEQPYLTVRHSTTVPHDFYVPQGAIARVEPDGVYLKQSRRTLRGKRYATPPEGEVGTGRARAAAASAEAVPTQSANAATTMRASNTGGPNGRVTEEIESSVSVPLVREDLVAQRSAEQVGTVRLHKGVETEERAFAVPVSHDEVIVEHIPADQLDAADAKAGANELLIPIMEEQIVVQKRMVVKEYVRVRKRQVVEQRQVREPVRREVLSVQEQRSAPPGQQEWPLVREMREPAPGAEESPAAGANANA